MTTTYTRVLAADAALSAGRNLLWYSANCKFTEKKSGPSALRAAPRRPEIEIVDRAQAGRETGYQCWSRGRPRERPPGTLSRHLEEGG